MLKFRAARNGRILLGLGLSHADVAYLQEGHPIHFHCEEMALARFELHEVLIFVGSTENEMQAELEAHGFADGVIPSRE
jgi:hypothetical protein